MCREESPEPRGPAEPTAPTPMLSQGHLEQLQVEVSGLRKALRTAQLQRDSLENEHLGVRDALGRVCADPQTKA